MQCPNALFCSASIANARTATTQSLSLSPFAGGEPELDGERAREVVGGGEAVLPRAHPARGHADGPEGGPLRQGEAGQEQAEAGHQGAGEQSRSAGTTPQNFCKQAQTTDPCDGAIDSQQGLTIYPHKTSRLQIGASDSAKSFVGYM